MSVRCPFHGDVPMLTQALEEQGNGRVLVVDGGGSMRCALLGDNIAEMAHKNGWSVSHLLISSTCSLDDRYLGHSKCSAAVLDALAAGCKGLVALGNSTGKIACN